MKERFSEGQCFKWQDLVREHLFGAFVLVFLYTGVAQIRVVFIWDNRHPQVKVASVTRNLKVCFLTELETQK